MSLTINELVLHEAVLDESELENLSSSFQTTKDTRQLVKRFQAKATVTPLLSKPETLPADLCVVLNDQYPEMVTADPIRDCELLKKYQTKKNRYPFHRQYRPLRIGSTQEIPKQTGAIEAVGAMMAGVSMFYWAILLFDVSANFQISFIGMRLIPMSFWKQRRQQHKAWIKR